MTTKNTFEVRRWLALAGPILVLLFSLQFLGGAGLLGAAMWRNEKARTAAVCIAAGLFALLGLGLLVFGVRYLRDAFEYDAVALEGSTLTLLRKGRAALEAEIPGSEVEVREFTPRNCTIMLHGVSGTMIVPTKSLKGGRALAKALYGLLKDHDPRTQPQRQHNTKPRG